jgi:hypothetical protein
MQVCANELANAMHMSHRQLQRKLKALLTLSNNVPA